MLCFWALCLLAYTFDVYCYEDMYATPSCRLHWKSVTDPMDMCHEDIHDVRIYHGRSFSVCSAGQPTQVILRISSQTFSWERCDELPWVPVGQVDTMSIEKVLIFSFFNKFRR